MKKYNHAFDVAFSLESEDEEAKDVTPLMLKQALEQRIQDLDKAGEWFEAVGAPFDTYVIEE